MNEEKKVFKPAGVEGEPAVVPVEEEEKDNRHHVTIQAGGQFSLSTNCHESVLLMLMPLHLVVCTGMNQLSV